MLFPPKFVGVFFPLQGINCTFWK